MTAEHLYGILADTVGGPLMVNDFMLNVGEALKSGEHLEYRFQGHLGIAGKLWLNKGKAPYVTCDPEDETAGRKQLITLANQDLAAMYARQQRDVQQ